MQAKGVRRPPSKASVACQDVSTCCPSKARKRCRGAPAPGRSSKSAMLFRLPAIGCLGSALLNAPPASPSTAEMAQRQHSQSMPTCGKGGNGRRPPVFQALCAASTTSMQLPASTSFIFQRGSPAQKGCLVFWEARCRTLAKAQSSTPATTKACQRNIQHMISDIGGVQTSAQTAPQGCAVSSLPVPLNHPGAGSKGGSRAQEVLYLISEEVQQACSRACSEP